MLTTRLKQWHSLNANTKHSRFLYLKMIIINTNIQHWNLKHYFRSKSIQLLPGRANGTILFLWTTPLPINIASVTAIFTSKGTIRSWSLAPSRRHRTPSVPFLVLINGGNGTKWVFALFISETNTDSNDEHIEYGQRDQIPQTISNLTVSDYNVLSLTMWFLIQCHHLRFAGPLRFHRQYQCGNDQNQRENRWHCPCFPRTTAHRREPVLTFPDPKCWE